MSPEHGFPTPIATYTLQVFAPTDAPAEEGSADQWLREDQRVLANLPALLEAAEEDLTKLLPDGYRAIIKDWDKEE